MCHLRVGCLFTLTHNSFIYMLFSPLRYIYTPTFGGNSILFAVFEVYVILVNIKVIYR
jgi:hypothetical protein